MRAGLSTIQQTLTPEAATVLNHSIAEAGRRNHSQTTPLHVAATLLAAPSGYLRQACIRSHPNSSHPLQCRALELCFSVALERLQTTAAGGGGGGEPPLSNALMAALKRAQAHQRRGCPEQQQQPLLAVKVELEQLIISILDDPSVSRVMREASFSSPAVKAAIEQSLQPCSAASVAINGGGAKIGMPFRPGPQPGPRNLYLNPRLQQQQQVNGNQIGAMNGDNVRRVIDILLRDKKRNPVLVGESEPEIVAKEVLKRVEKKELEVPLKEAEVVSMVKELGSDFSQMGVKVRELGGLIERRLMGFTAGGIVLDLGDLKWLVDPPGGGGGGGALEVGRLVVAEIGKILKKYNDGGNGGTLWVMGTATCETYLRCQVYHPSMENEWDLQVVSIVARAPPPGMLSRLGPNGILSSSVECLSPLKSFPTIAPPLTRRVSENLDPSRSPSCCPQCLEKYEQEHTKLVAVLADKPEVKSEATRQSLPAWLQYAKLQNKDVNDGCDLSQSKDQDMILKQKTQELQKKWTETCFHLHPNFHHNSSSERIAITPLSLTGLYNPTLLSRQPLQPKLPQSGTLCGPRHLNIGLSTPSSPPGSPVRTDLVLGRTKPEETPARSRDLHVDADSFKRLLKGLIEKVWWQKEAATAVATTVVQCKSGNGNHRPGGSNGGDIWLLFSGPDRVGKKKMAAALSELVCGVAPVVISLGSRRDSEESDLSFRGKTAIDRIAEAVRRNPFSLIMLRDIDEADTLVRGSIKRAIEKGRLADSHGREISLGNIIFVVTTNEPPDEEKLESLATGCWRLRICLGEKTGKRQPSWILDEGRAIKHRKETGPSLSFDLNEMADIADDRLDGSHNSSDLTVDNDENRHDHHGENHHELAESVDGTVVFSPVDFDRIRRDIERKITTKFSTIMEDKLSIKIDHEALERILSGIFSGPIGLEAWTNNVLVPNIQKLKSSLPASAVSPTENPIVARLELYAENDTGHGEPLPSKIMVLVDGQ